MGIRVLVVDDSAMVRRILSEMIRSAPDLELVAAVADTSAAHEAVLRLRPDVMTLDVEMPGQNGIDYLAELMRTQPMPVVMISSATQQGSDIAFRALELGAVDFFGKPQGNEIEPASTYARQFLNKIRAAFVARNLKSGAAPAWQAGTALTLEPGAAANRFVFIGASTGGTEAIRDVLQSLPEEMPPILIVQHMPAAFTGAFARRLDAVCRISVKEAEHGEVLSAGVAYLAPGNYHLRIARCNGKYQCELDQSAPVCGHRPAVDVLFQSAAEYVGVRGLGLLLTGMGKDGADGMLAMRKAGAHNIVQDRDSSVVWGMPREASVNGAAHQVLPLREISFGLLDRLNAQAKNQSVKALA